MGHSLSQSELTKIRVALSDPFNDFPVDYDYIASQVKGVDPQILYEILYSDVAPVCFTNIAAVLPTVWTGFDPDSLNAMIEERHAARRNSWFRRQFDKLLVVWLRYNYGYIWKEISARL